VIGLFFLASVRESVGCPGSRLPFGFPFPRFSADRAIVSFSLSFLSPRDVFGL